MGNTFFVHESSTKMGHKEKNKIMENNVPLGNATELLSVFHQMPMKLHLEWF